VNAVRFHTQGGPEVLIFEEAPTPKLSPGEVLVRVRATGVNRIDIWVRNGRYKTYVPHILGTDVAGEVSEVAPGVTNVKKGDRVVLYPVLSDGTCRYCRAGRPNRCVNIGLLGSAADGGYAEFVKVPSGNVVGIEELDFKVAAALPVNFGTSWNALVSRTTVGPGDEVLVWGAGSGLGHAAIQIAKLFGARVIATAGNEDKLKLARSLGADHTINHNTEDVPETVKKLTDGLGATVVFDHIGGDTWSKSLDSLAKGGTLISIGLTSGPTSNVDVGKFYRSELNLAGTYAFRKQDLTSVLKLASEGRLKPHIYREFPLEAAQEAHRILERRQQFGKILLLPQHGLIEK
jgi:NADPH:quinone reductase-like Zn-dependent oxidoreductase